MFGKSKKKITELENKIGDLKLLLERKEKEKLEIFEVNQNYRKEIADLKNKLQKTREENKELLDLAHENGLLRSELTKITFLLEDLTLFNINNFDFSDERLEKAVKELYIKVAVYKEIEGLFNV